MRVRLPTSPALPLSVVEQLRRESRPAILLDSTYRIVDANEAYIHRYGPVPEASRCFEVSHGYSSPCDENGEECPLRRAQETGHRERVFHVHHAPSGPEHVDVLIEPLLGGRYFLECVELIEEASATDEGEFAGRSQAFLDLVGLLRRGAPSEVPILLLGESGTGKELAARAVHQASHRSTGPFVPLECSGLGEALFESELFGHAKGAFTGAHVRKAGLVESARGGTLFLDEIGDVPLSLQVKLLRLLESGTYRPVGDTVARSADFRLVCATHRSLEQMVADGSFRQDLYYRINAFPILLPPLRERSEDIPLLCRAMLRSSGKQINEAALVALASHRFPGNIRELRNILERAVLLSDDAEIELRHLPLSASNGRTERALDEKTVSSDWPWGDQVLPLADVEEIYLRWAARVFRGDRRELAELLKLSERTLYRKLSNLGD